MSTVATEPSFNLIVKCSVTAEFLAMVVTLGLPFDYQARTCLFIVKSAVRINGQRLGLL